MDEWQRDIIKNLSEINQRITDIVGILNRPKKTEGRVKSAFEVAGAVVSVLSILSIIDIIKNWIGG
jgi:hypothetical protein